MGSGVEGEGGDKSDLRVIFPIAPLVWCDFELWFLNERPAPIKRLLSKRVFMDSLFLISRNCSPLLLAGKANSFVITTLDLPCP